MQMSMLLRTASTARNALARGRVGAGHLGGLCVGAVRPMGATVQATQPGGREDKPEAALRHKLDDGRTLDGIEYCPYTKTSQTYDQRRVNPGINVVLGSMLQSPWPLKEQDFLDVGCGTGSWLQQMHGQVRSLSGIDYNEGMLGKAMTRFGNGEAHLQQGCAQDLPFEDERFHGCTMNQIIHHFSPADNFQEARDAIKECHRVLKPGGVLVINCSAPEQQRDGFWWLSLFPENSERMCTRFAPITTLRSHLADVGFEACAFTGGVVIPVNQTLMHPSRYLDGGVELAFDESYRNCDSSWEMPSAELNAGLEKLRGMMKDGSAESWLSERELLRQRTGQMTFLIARKPLD